MMVILKNDNKDIYKIFPHSAVDLKHDNKDIYKIFPHSAVDLKPLFNYLKEIEDRESFSIYKLEVDFGIFRILYDDDSFLSITGQFSNKEEFILFFQSQDSSQIKKSLKP